MMTPAAVEADQTRGWVHDSTARVSGQKVRAQSAVLDEMVRGEGPSPQLCRCALIQQAECCWKMHGRLAIPVRGGDLYHEDQIRDPDLVYRPESARVWQGW